MAIRQVQAVDSLDLPALRPYRTLREQADHLQQRLFVAEGEKVVRRLLESRLLVVSALMPERWYRELEPLIAGRPEPADVYLADKTVLERLTGFSMYQGLLATGRVPESRSLDDILQPAARPHLFAAVDGLSNAENLGVVVRNCAAFGVQALIVGETCCHPYLRRAVRASMGAIFGLPVVECSELARTLQELGRHGVRCVAAHPHTDRRFLPDTDLAADCCLVFGSEGDGLSPAVLAACAEAVAIPMPTDVDSLNVGSASAAFLYEAWRQRHHTSR
jgi:tRNA G18 (ribose-2'-O)-methylase SpoU